jgi:hypothetical protein
MESKEDRILTDDELITELFMVGISEPQISDSLRKLLLDFRPGSVILTMRLFQQNGSTKKDNVQKLTKDLHTLEDSKGILNCICIKLLINEDCMVEIVLKIPSQLS